MAKNRRDYRLADLFSKTRGKIKEHERTVQSIFNCSDNQFLSCKNKILASMLSVPAYSQVIKRQFPKLDNKTRLKIWCFAIAYKEAKIIEKVRHDTEIIGD